MEKKENSCRGAFRRKQQYATILRSCKAVDETDLSLVNVNNIYNLNIPRWKELTKAQKAAVFSKYIVDGSWVAITLLFSNEFMQNCARQPKLTDFIRRRLNENFKNRIGYVPEYMFCLEFKDDAFHIHGVLKCDNNLDAIKKVLKTTAFGRNYTKNPLPENRKVNCRRVYNSYGWGNYILKNCNNPWFDIYLSSPVRDMIRKKYGDLHCKSQLIKLKTKAQNKKFERYKNDSKI